MKRRRRAVGFYTKGRGRGRKVIPITGRSRYVPREVARPETHTHWMATDKWWENIEHPAHQLHSDVRSKVRHDLETGKLQRWAKRKGLKLTDATYDMYDKKIKEELEAQKKSGVSLGGSSKDEPTLCLTRSDVWEAKKRINQLEEDDKEKKWRAGVYFEEALATIEEQKFKEKELGKRG